MATDQTSARGFAWGSALPALLACAVALPLALLPGRAQEPGHPATLRPAHAGEGAHACLNQKERRAAIENGTAMRLAAATTASSMC